MAVVVYAIANEAAARHVDTARATRKYRDGVTRRARQNLAAANETSRVSTKDYFPAEIESKDGDVDRYTVLHAPNAMALEFGHAPSGFFDPDGPWLPGNNSKPPAPEYILTRAAIGGVVS